MINVGRDAATLHLKKGGNNMRDNPAPIILSKLIPSTHIRTTLQSKTNPQLLNAKGYQLSYRDSSCDSPAVESPPDKEDLGVSGSLLVSK